jgi:hypothetical protein
VNLNEERQREQEEGAKSAQEELLGELTGTIKELEQLSQGLQAELVQKEQAQARMQADYARLDG